MEPASKAVSAALSALRADATSEVSAYAALPFVPGEPAAEPACVPLRRMA